MSSSTLSSSTMEYDPISLSFIATKLAKMLDIKDRRYHLRQYKSCFVCSDVIDVMINQRMVNSREEGVELGIALQKQLNLWQHVVDDHVFSDNYLFFRLTTTEDDDTEIGEFLIDE